MTRNVAVVTGAGSGIGRVVARALLDAEWSVALAGRRAEALEETADGTDAALVVPTDVADPASVTDLFAAARGEWGRVDLLINNAGTFGPVGGVDEIPIEGWLSTVAVNLTGAFLTLRTGLRLMRDGGAIVLVASSMALKPSPGAAGYGASKAALLQLTRIAALEAAPRGIRVNAISPGGVETPLFRGQDFFEGLIAQTGSERSAYDALAARTPLGRYASAEETAGLIAFLMSAEAAQITGANLVADAGMTL